MIRRLPVALLFLAWMLGVEAVAADVKFTKEEKQLIASFGPWPMEWRRDQSNRFSGNPKAIKLGEMLFADRNLSRQNNMSCADCHQPDGFFADGVSLNEVHGNNGRHTSSLLNIRYNNWFGWGGESDSLWMQSLRPLVSDLEMNMSVKEVADHVRAIPNFAGLIGEDLETLSDEDVYVLTGKILAAYQETIVTGPSAFDRFRNALVENDVKEISSYSQPAKRGLKIFIGQGQCFFCHLGPSFTNGEFADIGVSQFIKRGQVDRGRYAGIQNLKKSPFTQLGAFSDLADKTRAMRTKHVFLQHRNFGEFKVPSLRNVAETAPYMHNGSIETLMDVVDFYSELDEERLHIDGEKILRPLKLSNKQKGDLVAFLRSLSEVSD